MTALKRTSTAENWRAILPVRFTSSGLTSPSPSQELADLLAQRLLVHENRYSRELALDLVTSLGGSAISTPQASQLLKPVAARGLVDEWNQVRLAAILATRALLEPRLHLCSSEDLDLVLPSLCFNRFNVADGVRPVAQHAWTAVVKTKGAELLQARRAKLVDFYVNMSRSNMDGDR